MLLATVADEQIVAATAASLTWQPTGSDGEPADPGGTVTVGVTRSNGTVVLADGTATTGATSSPRVVQVTAAQTADIDWLTATWKVGSVTVATTVHEILGRPMITRAQFISREPKMTATALTDFLDARREADRLFLSECHQSFVPRFAVERIEPHDWCAETIVLHYPNLRAVRWMNVITSDGTSTAVDVSTVRPDPGGIVRLQTHVSTPLGSSIEVGYVHGMATPPHDVLGAFARYTRDVIGGGTSQIPDRATSYSDGQGGVTQLATPGLGPFITGIPEVDQVIVANRRLPVPHR
jgi:hypothetical protein